MHEAAKLRPNIVMVRTTTLLVLIINIFNSGLADQNAGTAHDNLGIPVTDHPIQRGGGRGIYVRHPLPTPYMGSTPKPRLDILAAGHLVPPMIHMEHPQQLDHEIPHARSGVRVPNGGFIGSHMIPVGNGRIGGRGDAFDRGHIIPGRGHNPGINPIHRQEHIAYGSRGSSIPVHGTVINKPVGDRYRYMQQGEEDDMVEEDLGNGEEGCDKPCSRGEFECTSSCACIKIEHRCDGDNDCPAGEDEIDCRPGPPRPACLETAGRIRCPKSALCISKDWLCDGDDDCGDFSDETNCGSRANCSVDQFECGNGLCIHRSWLCDDDNDCKDNSDELNCTRTQCTADEFRCADGKCISLAWRCDKENDCEDNSDESDCPPAPPMCSEGEFQCHNKKCIRKDFKCDGDNDCGDWSDEDICPLAKSKCSKDEFRCKDGKCLAQSWRCDKERDCENGEDEEGCGPSTPKICSPDEFTCGDGKCILNTWVCDGVPDCSTGEDETKCEVSCEEGQFMCKPHSNNTLSSAFRTCVNRKHVCDGQRDCPLGDDEENCPQKRICETGTKCNQICITTAAGKPGCSCHPGYVLSDDGVSCKDIDECMYVQDPVCSQTCSNTIGTFTCGCMTGYVLRPDLRTCKALGASPTLLFTNRAEVRQVSLNSEKYISIIKGLHNAVALDYHYEKKLIFWAELLIDTIRVANVNGTNITDVIKWGMDKPAGIAVDWVHDLIFWTDTGTTRVEVASLDGGNRGVVAACDLDKPRAIAVHPGDAIVFWTDWGPSPKIERSDMDGSSRRTIISESIFWPNGLTLDFTTSKLYWTDAKHHVIESSRFDGTERKKVVSKGLPHPYSLTIFEDAIFWTDWHTKSISTVNKKTGVGFQTVHSGLNNPMDIHSFHPQRQPPYNNHCGPRNGGCSHLCLPNRTSYTCRCPIGQVVGSDKKTCQDASDRLLLFVKRQEIRLRQLEAENPEIGAHMVIPLNGIKSAVSLAWDAKTKSIYWADNEKYTINYAALNGSNQSELITTSIGNPTSLAFDWITNKLYWVDEEYKRIEACNADGSMRTVLIWDQLDMPRDIVLDPNSGTMYWSDWGKTPSINTAHMDGTTKKKVVTTNLSSPQGLTMDYSNGRLYWADPDTKRIEHCKLDGSDRTVLMENVAEPGGLDIFGELIYWADVGSKNIQSANKLTGKDQKEMVKQLKSCVDLRVYHTERRVGINRCGKNNGGCSHLCLLKPNGYSCRCPIGIKLMEDRKTCANGPTNFLIFAHRIDIRQISLDVPYVIDLVLPLPRLKSALAVDVDRKTGEIYWTDTAEDIIHKATPDGKKLTKVISTGLHTADGIVIDSTGRKIYWTDQGRNSIEVAELDGTNRKLLIYENLDSPRAIALHYHLGMMFWSDWGAHAKIESANMDGNNRRVIIGDNLVWPNGLAIDRPSDRLYWNDAKRLNIESSNLDGLDRKVILQDVPYPYGLVIVGSHVYWTDWKTEALHRADKNNGSDRTIIKGKLEGLMDVRSIQTDNVVENACGRNNGGCSHLCLRSPQGYSCACPTGTLFFSYPYNTTSMCQPHPNNYLVFATRTSLARVSLDTPELWDVSLPVAEVQNAIAVDFSWEKKLIYYSDVSANLIRSVSMANTSNVTTIVASGLETPNGIGVDWIANNLYWSDNDLKKIEVARLDGSCRKVLINEGLDEPRAIVVFPRKGYIFWTDWGETPRIERSLLDGTKRIVIINTDLGFPNGLALDYKEKRLYWADALKDRIETADLHGGNRVQVVPEATHPFGMTQFGDYIYWTDWFKKAVMRANKTTGQNVTAIKTDLEVVMEIKAVSAERQKGWNPCREENGGCTHLCLFRGDNYTCACPDVPDGKICLTDPLKWISNSRPGSETTPDEYEQEKEYDDKYIGSEIYNQSIQLRRPQRKSIDNFGFYLFIFSLLAVVVVVFIGFAIIFVVVTKKHDPDDKREFRGQNRRVISFPNPNYNSNTDGTPGPTQNTERRRTNRFQIFRYERNQDRITNVYSPEGASLIAATHTPSSTHCTVTPEAHPSPQHDGFDSIALNSNG